MVKSKVLLLLVAIAGVYSLNTLELTFKVSWRARVGWEMLCSWTFPPEDRLQSVHWYRGSSQIKIYRPELYGESYSEDFNATDSLMRLKCTAQEPRRGACMLTLTPHRLPASITVYACEVSGERPTFRMAKKEYELESYVASLDAHIDVKTKADKDGKPVVVLNCSATGIPTPTIAWTVDKTPVRGDSPMLVWNMTTRLMHTWSTLSVSPRAGPLPVHCASEQRTHRRALTVSPDVTYLVPPMDQIVINQANRLFNVVAEYGCLLMIVCFLLH